MKKFIAEFWRIAVITVLGTLGSMVAGLMVYGGEIFRLVASPFAYYIAYGASSACIFSFYRVRGLSNTVSAAMVVGAILFVGISFLMPVLYAVIYSFGVTTSVILLAFLFERKLSYLKHWKFIVVGIIFGEVFVLLNLITMLSVGVSAMIAPIFQRNFLDGLWMGVGLGLGVEIAESLIHSVDLHTEIKRTATKK